MNRVGELKNSELLFENVLTLPLHNQLNQEQQERVCKIIKETLEN